MDLRKIHSDGVIFMGTESPEQILPTGLPAIAVDVRDQVYGLANIVGDCKNIGEIAAKHFLERGFNKFAFCGFDDIHWSRERGAVFAETLKDAGFETYFFQKPSTKTRHTWDKQQNQIAQWLKTLPLPVGLMACNDDCAQNIVQACKIAGLHIPYDVAILGVDNDQLVCNLTDPTLSSISLNFRRAGYEAAEQLDKMMTGEKPSQDTIVIQATHINSRQSTDIMAIEDRDVAKAVRFIRHNAKKDFYVDDVVADAGLARRTLERRFIKIVGHSINREIVRARVKQIAQMLVETNISVASIAMDLGYPGYEHISRYFRKEMGCSPLEYRKKYGQK